MNMLAVAKEMESSRNKQHATNNMQHTTSVKYCGVPQFNGVNI